MEAKRWWLPLRSLLRIGPEKVGRHPLHGLFATLNVLSASVIAGTVRRDMMPGLHAAPLSHSRQRAAVKWCIMAPFSGHA